jgi:hypothetical protein
MTSKKKKKKRQKGKEDRVVGSCLQITRKLFFFLGAYQRLIGDRQCTVVVVVSLNSFLLVSSSSSHGFVYCYVGADALQPALSLLYLLRQVRLSSSADGSSHNIMDTNRHFRFVRVKAKKRRLWHNETKRRKKDSSASVHLPSIWKKEKLPKGVFY